MSDIVIKDEPFEMNALQTLLYKQLHVLPAPALISVLVFIDAFSTSPTQMYKRYEGIFQENKLKLIRYSN